MTLQKTKMESLKDDHQDQKTSPQDQTTSVQGDCNPHKIWNTTKPNKKYIKIQENIKNITTEKQPTTQSNCTSGGEADGGDQVEWTWILSISKQMERSRSLKKQGLYGLFTFTFKWKRP